MKARILVPDREFADVRPGAPVRVKVLPYPFRTYSGHVDQILPAAAADIPVSQTQRLTRLGQELTNHIAVIMEFPNPDNSLSAGMTGVAKIRTGIGQSRGKRVAPLGTGCDLRSGGEQVAILARAKKKGPPFLGRRPFGVAATSNSRPSGAQGRKTVKISDRAFRLPLHRQAAHGHQRRLALEFFASARISCSSLLVSAVGFIAHSSSADLSSPKLCSRCSAIRRPKKRSLVSSENKTLARELDCSDSVFSRPLLNFPKARLNYSTIGGWLASFLPPETFVLLV